MRYSVETISRDFTPAEAATVTGVSTTLQRDWRRRGVIESKADGTWTRWRLEDIIRLAVMKLLSDAGVDVSSTKIIAHMAILPTLVAMEEIDGAVVFEGDEIPDLSRERIRAAAANDYLNLKGVIVRPVGGYGLPQALRITIGTEDQNRAVIDALSEFAAQ